VNDLITGFNEAQAALTAPGAPFEWEIEHIAGVPTRVFKNAPPHMRVIWEASAAYGAGDYLVYGDERYSYADAHARVRVLACWLHEACDVGRGDRVAVAMRNYPEWVLCYWAVTSLGAAVVGLNGWWTAREMTYALRDSAPKVLIADGERLERLRGELPGLESPPVVVATRIADGADAGGVDGTDGRRAEAACADGVRHWDEIVSDQAVALAPDALPPADIESDDDACIFYTSGTTGVPKGARITQRGSVHNLMNVAFITACGDAARARRTAAQHSGAQPDPPAGSADPPAQFRPLAESEQPEESNQPGESDLPGRSSLPGESDQPAESNQPEEPDQPEAAPVVALLPVPLFHVTGCNCVLHPVTAAGGRLVLMYRWDAAEALRLIESERVTVLTGVPTMSRELLAHPSWAGTDTSSLASMGGGGAALQPDLVQRIDHKLEAGRPSTGYGLTETTGIATAINNEYYVARPGSVGPVVPCMEAKVVDPETREELAPGQTGELALRGPNVIKGYLNQPDATAEAIVEGWFHTGDLAFIDSDGWVHIADRLKDVVIRGGENIHCNEVEAAIYEHDAVAEAAVFGVPDELLGETVAAAVVLAPGAELDASGLAEHLSDRIAAFKHPARVWFLDEPLPRNANGKFLKRELRERLAPA